MTHYYRITHCPHCNALTDYSHTTRSQLVGNPMRICRKCQGVYFDPSYKEDAVYYYEQNCMIPSKGKVLGNLLLIVLWGFVFLVSLFAIVTVEITWYSLCLILIEVVLGTIIYFMLRYVINAIKCRRNPEKFIPLSLAHMEKDVTIAQSLDRLRNPDYLEFLTDNGVDVPTYFFERISYVPQKTFAEKQKEKEERAKKELDVLKEEQKKWKNAKYFLSTRCSSKELKDIAQKSGMTPNEFREYCKQTILAYESIHRKYNETHAIPAPWPNEY